MALTIVFPAAPGPIGPGYYCQVQNPALGPYPIDDIIQWTIKDGAGNILSQLRMQNKQSSAFPAGLMGFIFDTAASTTPRGKVGPALAGAAVTVAVLWTHANGAFVDQVTAFPAYSWEPVGGLGALVNFLASGRDGTAGDILAAVRTTFPVTH